MTIFRHAWIALLLAIPSGGVAAQATVDSIFTWDGERSFKAYHLYSGSDGMSHLEVMDMPLQQGPTTPSGRSKRIFGQEVGRAFLGASVPKELGDWHYAINQHLIISVQGDLRFDLGDGKEYLLHPGQAVLAEDWTGKGHRSGCDPRNKGNCVSIDIEIGPIAKTYPLRTPPAAK